MLYYVKNAIILCVEELVDISHLRRSGFWSSIWRLKMSPKDNNIILAYVTWVLAYLDSTSG